MGDRSRSKIKQVTTIGMRILDFINESIGCLNKQTHVHIAEIKGNHATAEK